MKPDMTTTPVKRALQSLVFPAADLALNRGSVVWLRRLEAFQWLDPETIAAQQRARLTTILRHALETVPYYRRVFTASGLTPGRIGPGTLHEVPVLTKGLLREEFPHGLLSSRVTLPLERLPLSRTSGVTTEATTVYWDPALASFNQATFRWLNRMAGVSFGDSEVHFARRIGDDDSRRMRLWRRFSGTRLVPLAAVMDRDGPAIAGLLNECRPQVIAGFVSLLRLGALALQDAGAKLEFTPKAVIAHSETLYPEVRDLLGGTFNAPVYSRYGAREFGGWVAQNCSEQIRVYEKGPERGGFHINVMRYFVEIVGSSGRAVSPGETGRILITDLGNRVMPLIRYQVGDMGSITPEPCPCGRGLPVLAGLIGRQAEYVHFPSGRSVHANYLNRAMRIQTPLLREYQFSQAGPADLTVSIVTTGAGYGETEATALKRAIVELIGERLEIEVRVVDDIPLEPSGKRLLVRSHLSRVGTRGE